MANNINNIHTLFPVISTKKCLEQSACIFTLNIFIQNGNILIQNGATDRRLAPTINLSQKQLLWSGNYWRLFLLVFICSSSSRLRSNRSIFSTIFPTATPVPKTARTNPANVMYSIIIITPPPFLSEGSYGIPPFQKGQPPTVMVAPCLLRLFYCIILLPSKQEQMFACYLIKFMFLGSQDQTPLSLETCTARHTLKKPEAGTPDFLRPTWSHNHFSYLRIGICSWLLHMQMARRR